MTPSFRALPLRDRAGSVVDHAFVDPEDYQALKDFRWCLSKGYVVRAVWHSGRQQAVLIQLHREILGLSPGDGWEADHENGNPLDNRRSNLRVATHAQNLQNRKSGYGSSSFRGVSWHKRKMKWAAGVKVDGKRHNLGLFDDEEEAARVAADARRKLMPYTTN